MFVVLFESGLSTTVNHVKIGKNAVMMPMITKAPLQPKASARSDRGVAAERHPIPPIAIRRPDILAYSRPPNHSARAFREETNVADTPNPTRTLANVAKAKDGAKAKSIDPKAATELNKATVFRAPQESERKPTGICVIA
jgi:hypothetical protein